MEISGKNSNLHIKARYLTFVNVQVMLPCVSFKEVSQADGSYNSGAPGTLTKADTVNSFSFPRPATEAQKSEGGGPKAAH